MLKETFEIKPAKEFPFTLLVNMAGYAAQEVELYEVTDEILAVSLSNDNILEEVVVVGYGEQKRKRHHRIYFICTR